MFENNLSYEKSELTESLTNDNSAFRISVRLQRYFEDVRALSYIMVTRQGEVRSLEKRIQKIFGLSGSFCLCANKHWLPSSEPLTLLCPGDVIEVLPFHEARERSPSAVSVNIRQEHNQSDESGRDAQMQNVDKCSPNATNYHEAKPNAVNKNMVAVHSEEGCGSSEIVIVDDVNGARLSHDKIQNSPHEENSRTKVDNENFTSSDKNYCNDMKDAYSLRQLKRRALALLDAHRSAVEARNDDVDVREASDGRDAVDAPDAVDEAAYEPPPRRARRRVRRRARRRTSGPEPRTEPEKEKYQESEKCLDLEKYRQLENCPDPEKDLDPEKYQESEKCPDPEKYRQLENCPDPEKDLDPEKYQESEKCPDPEKYPESKKYMESEKDLESEKDMDFGLEPRSEVFTETEPYSSINAGSQCESDSEGALSPPRARLFDAMRIEAARARFSAVTRNEAARARQPRLVRALPD